MDEIDKYYRGYVEINLDAIYKNMVALKKNVDKDTKMVAVVKADGYGHGAVPVAKTVDPLVEAYAVATIDEALNLRSHDIKKPIYILGHIHESRYKEAIINHIRPAVFKYETAEKLSEIALSLGKQCNIHLKIDTGMGRIGFIPCQESINNIVKISKLKGINIEGIFTHFASSDSKDKEKAEKQFYVFQKLIEDLEGYGIKIPVKHCSNSAGIIDMHSANMNEVRAGIALYGLYPSEEVDKRNVDLIPAMTMKSHVIYIKNVAKGTGISYGSTYVTEKESMIATIPVGYGDGYPRNLSNKGYVLIGGKRAPIVGRVCMDQLMIDVTGICGVSEGDEVILFGGEGVNKISIEEIAELAGTFNYEFICGIGKRIPRVYKKTDKIIGVKDYFKDEYLLE